ncbi:hypothetical protein FB451DRAFT_1425962 [Mycena latifolia]|nr:hypothetical protein FB451DRAFT_1425962 [Mycena latifolia]
MHASLRAQISKLTLAIANQKQLLDGMEMQLKGLQLELDSVIYPVLTLPPEITSEIFLHCLPAKRHCDAVNTTEAPLLLMHVCRAWRQIAVSTPALWRTLDIDATGLEACFSEVIQVWLKRAGRCPLSVKIKGPLSKIDKFSGFLNTFRRYAGGMRSLELDISDAQDISRMDTRPLNFPLLIDLSIRASVIMAPARTHRAVRLLVLSGAPPPFVSLPWQQLTKFTGEFYRVAECLEALRLMPNLVECRFAVYDSNSSDHVSHPKLESLTLFTSKAYLTNARSTRLLEFLTLPGLRALYIQDTRGFDEAVLDEFLTRSAPPLRTLIIRPHELRRATTIQDSSFQTISGLTHLEIWYPSEDFVYLFFERFGWDTSLLPQLQSLSLMCRGEYGEARESEVVDIAAAPIAERRSWKGGPLFQSFRMMSVSENIFYSYPDKALLPYRNLKAEGMDLYIGDTECVL